MCGIIGVAYAERHRVVADATLKAMTDSIGHRGPDDEGWYTGPGVGLGMRRLSIIDLASGHQPIYNEDRTCVIVFNGEIYNHVAIRRELEARGHRFETHSDTEAILHAFEEYGADCVTHLRGMFAFAIWNERTQSLFIARDRFGIKPLHYSAGAWGLAFGSEIRALVAGGFSEQRLDPQGVDAYFQLGYVPVERSIFADVRKLPAAHTLEWRRGTPPVIKRYWNLPATDEGRAHPSDEEVLGWIDESVEAHLVSDVPVAAFLSGGMDSSAVVSSMAVLGQRPHAFTVRYLGAGAADADEVPLASELAARYGVELTVVDVDPDVRNLFPAIMRALDEPIADESAIPSWLLYERVARDYKVGLAGTGGDELFIGYRRHMAMLLDERIRRIPSPARAVLGRLANWLPEPSSGGLAVNRIKRYLRTDGTGTASGRYLGYLTKTTRDQRANLLSGEFLGAVDGTLARRFEELADDRSGGDLRTALTLDYKVYLPDDLLALSDRLSMAHSLEVRVPFVDHVLVERAFALREALRVKGLKAKWLLRRALRLRLPAAHFAAPKRGFVGPTASWLRNEMRDMLIDELSPGRIAELGLFDNTLVQRLIHDHFSQRQNNEGVLWSLLTLASWIAEHRGRPMAKPG